VRSNLGRNLVKSKILHGHENFIFIKKNTILHVDDHGDRINPIRLYRVIYSFASRMAVELLEYQFVGRRPSTFLSSSAFSETLQ
jgi:hypothetical protein